MAIRRLIVDIETSPNVGFFWSAGFKLNITPENILEERKIICIAWKWEGERGVAALTWNRKQCDRKMLKEFIPILDSADEVVWHNGDRFDYTWIRTRALFHSIPMAPSCCSQDTLKIARKLFRFNSNRLDYIARYLGFGGKIKTDFNLWKRVLKGEKKALEEMVVYCKGDVELLERVWQRFATYTPPKSHVTGVVRDCPECGGWMKINKTRITAFGHKKAHMVCVSCRKPHTVAFGRV